MQPIGKWTAGALLGCSLSLGGSGCGETSSDGDGDASNVGGTHGGEMEGPVSFEAFPARLADVLCDWIAPCCPGLDLPFDAGDCARNFERGLTEMWASASPDNYAYDSALAGDCLTTARAFYGQVGCDVEGLAAEDAVRVCNGAFGGTLEPGAPCANAIECAAASDESVDCGFVGGEGVCVVTRRATEGETCDCVQSLGIVSCSLEPVVHGVCYPDDGLYCGDDVCKPKPAWAEPCEPNAVCIEGFCVDGVCTNTTDERDCEADTDCGEYGYCTRGTCAADKPKGATCERDHECLSYFCGEGECAERPRFGINIDIARLCYEASD